MGSEHLQVALQPPAMSRISRTEEQLATNGRQDQLVTVSQDGLAGGNLQGLLLGGVQDQGGTLAVAQLQALTLNENQLGQQVGSPVKSGEGGNVAAAAAPEACDPGVQSPLSWAEALGQVGQVDVGGWGGGGQEASNLFQELATLQ